MFETTHLNLIIVIAVSILIVLGVTAISKAVQNFKLNQMIYLLNEKNFDAFDKVIDSRLVRLVFAPFNINYIKLNSFLVRNDKSKINEMFDAFESVHLNHKQRDEIDLKAFNYYLSVNDTSRCKKYLDMINYSKTNKMKKEANRLYSVYVEKDSKYLTELLEETKTVQDKYKGANELLISVIYGNLGNKQKEEEYLQMAENHLAQLN